MQLSRARRSAMVAAATFVLFGSSVMAQDTGEVVQEITPNTGAFSVVLTDLVMSPVAASASAQTTNGDLVALTTDLRGVTSGFSVTLAASDFEFELVQGSLENVPAIPASGFQRVGAATVTGTGTGAPAATYTGPLDAAQKVIVAEAGVGAGVYTATMPVALDIPANTVPGTYTSSLTVTIVDGP